MGNEIEKFDPSTLMQGVKDRIKSTFVSLIPDDKWEELVNKEVNAFFNEEVELSIFEEQRPKDKTNSYWGEKDKFSVLKTKATPFRQIIWSFCSEETLNHLKSEILKNYFTTTWINNSERVHENMKKAIAEAAPAALINLFQAISFNNVSAIQSQIQNYQK